MRPSKRGLDSGHKCGLIGAIMRTTQHLTVAGSTMTRELVCRCCDVTSVADISGKYQTSHQQPAATGPREPGPTWSNQSSHPNPIWNRPTGGNVRRLQDKYRRLFHLHQTHTTRCQAGSLLTPSRWCQLGVLLQANLTYLLNLLNHSFCLWLSTGCSAANQANHYPSCLRLLRFC